MATDVINVYLFAKFDKMVLTIPEPTTHTDRFYKPVPYKSTHDMRNRPTDTSVDILPIIKKYIPTDCFDRSGYELQKLYEHLTVNRPFANGMSNRVYFDIYIRPIVSAIDRKAVAYKEQWDLSGDGVRRLDDERNNKCKRFVQELLNVIKTDETHAPKKKKQVISATTRRLVWNIHIGEAIGKAKCMCCGVTDITQLAFNCGHIVAEAKGGATIVSNLKPICQNCNSSMGTKDMNEFMKTFR